MSAPEARLVLIAVDAALPVGLLGARAWDALRAADGVVLTADAAWRDVLEPWWVEIIELDPRGSIARRPEAERDAALEAAATGVLAGIARVGRGAWLLPLPELEESRRIARRALELADATGEEQDLIEVIAPPASNQPASNQPAPNQPATDELSRSVAVMDALRSPGGDAWSAEQTHESLARYLLEETHEVLEVIEQAEAGPERDRALIGELGDILFQVLFHARLGEEADPAWGIQDVAAALNAKMHRRNPHVFGEDAEGVLAQRDDVEAIIAQWHAAKRAEGRDTGLFGGIPAGLPALQQASKVVHRARSAARLAELREAAERTAREAGGAAGRESLTHALALLDVVIAAEAQDIDPESALRTLLRRMAAADPTVPHDAP